jgi:hypothetical protein
MILIDRIKKIVSGYMVENISDKPYERAGRLSLNRPVTSGHNSALERGSGANSIRINGLAC